MPQEFHVVRCYACLVFQVQQVKKAHKWACKMCGEKQSLKKEYGRGSGADCRRHVQKLNMIAGGWGGTGCTPDPSPEQCQATANSSFDEDFRDVTENRQDSLENTEVEAPLSKWQAFIDEDGTDEIPEGPTQEDHSHPRLGSAEITLSRPAYRGRGGRRHGGWKSARKRKRDDPDQDIDAESGTASLQNANFSCLGFRQTWPTSASGFKTTRLQDQGNIFRDVANAKEHPRDSMKLLSNLGDPDEVQTKKAGQKFGMNESRAGTAPRKTSKKQNPGEAGPCVSSKWGQFLQDCEDESGDEEDTVDIRGHGTNLEGDVSSVLTRNQQEFEDRYNSPLQFSSTEFKNQRESTVNPIQPAKFQESHSMDNKSDSMRTQSRDESAQSSKNGGCSAIRFQKNLFSVGDEFLLDEVFEESW